MEKSINNKQEFPGEYFNGEFKRYTNKHNFFVKRHNADINVTTIKPGIYIRLCRPDNKIKEVIHFPFGQEFEAEEKYQKIIKKLQEWDSIEK